MNQFKKQSIKKGSNTLVELGLDCSDFILSFPEVSTSFSFALLLLPNATFFPSNFAYLSVPFPFFVSLFFCSFLSPLPSVTFNFPFFGLVSSLFFLSIFDPSSEMFPELFPFESLLFSSDTDDEADAVDLLIGFFLALVELFEQFNREIGSRFFVICGFSSSGV